MTYNEMCKRLLTIDAEIQQATLEGNGDRCADLFIEKGELEAAVADIEMQMEQQGEEDLYDDYP